MSAAPDHPSDREFTYSRWSEHKFADAVAVAHPGNRLIFASGKGSEDPETGEIHFPGDCAAQTKYAYAQISRILEHHGASLEHIVRLTVFLTRMENRVEYEECQREVFADIPHMPSHTLIGVTALAHPGMVVEIEATAMIDP